MTGDDYVYIKEKESIVYTVDYSVLEAVGESIEDYRTEEETTTEDEPSEATKENEVQE